MFDLLSCHFLEFLESLVEPGLYCIQVRPCALGDLFQFHVFKKTQPDHRLFTGGKLADGIIEVQALSRVPPFGRALVQGRFKGDEVSGSAGSGSCTH